MTSLLKNSKGQLSIFLAITVVFFITAVAFVVNIGLFVKAKINLQNAVDAGAFSGAAVQARQLTDIAYLNWEMRNTYKEWMFKYYVLGNLNTTAVENINATKNNNIPPDMMDFTVGKEGASDQDLNNIPSVCVQLGQQQYCRIFKTPGIPRMSNEIIFQKELANFGKDFIDTIAEKKAEKCADASQINFLIAKKWAYGMGSDVDKKIEDIPNVGGDRPGAFPKAIELALRVRNLEAIVNKAPYQESICESGNCSTQIQAISSKNEVANERVVKAFYSAWRNLGGDKNRELKETFKMSELGVAPAQIEGGDKSISYTFIPSNSQARNKYFLDLQLYSINFATFYTMMTPISDNNPNAPADAGCKMTKIAIPVPAYPFGYVKNPDVMTYYGIKGESRFNGLFNPLKGQIPVTAYALAKPFGGRIGPRLFRTVGNKITALADQGQRYRTSAYAFGLKPGSPGGNSDIDNILGVLPRLADFWVQDKDQPIGGDSEAGLPKFVIPNMHYDLRAGEEGRWSPTENIHIMNAPTGGEPEYSVAMYNRTQFKKLFDNLSTSGAFNGVDQVTQENIRDAIFKVRLPTPYEARNYLIPSTENLNSPQNLNLNTFGMRDNHFEIYAPLYGANTLFDNSQTIQGEIESYVKLQKTAIDTFTQTMLTTSETLRNMQSANDPNTQYASQAANVIHDQPLTCKSIAGQFAYYYLGSESGVDETDCPTPFPELLREYFDNNQLIQPEFYREDKAEMIVENRSSQFIFSAYSPGTQRGFAPNGSKQNPFSKQISTDLRNFYSTKFISFDTYDRYHSQGGLYVEGGDDSGGNGQLQNPLLPVDNFSMGEIFR